MSLDGCIADRNGGVDWLYGNSPGEGGGSYESFAAGVDTVIMGRRTYEQVTTELSVGGVALRGHGLLCAHAPQL